MMKILHAGVSYSYSSMILVSSVSQYYNVINSWYEFIIQYQACNNVVQLCLSVSFDELACVAKLRYVFHTKPTQFANKT